MDLRLVYLVENGMFHRLGAGENALVGLVYLTDQRDWLTLRITNALNLLKDWRICHQYCLLHIINLR